ncbi:MAG: ATP-binding protein [Reichenbachiella sp.]
MRTLINFFNCAVITILLSYPFCSVIGQNIIKPYRIEIPGENGISLPKATLVKNPGVAPFRFAPKKCGKTIGPLFSMGFAGAMINEPSTYTLSDSVQNMSSVEATYYLKYYPVKYPKEKATSEFRFKDNSRFNVKYLDVEQGLSSSYIYDILEDKRGNMWFATYAGLSKYDGTFITTWTTKELLPDNNITALAEDSNGNIWIGTVNGLVKFDGEQFIMYPNSDSIPLKYIYKIYEDSEKTIWVGTKDGLFAIKEDSIQHFTTEQGLSGNTVRTIIEDKLGQIWVGTYGGLSMYNGDRFTNYRKQEGLVGNRVFSMIIDSRDNLWIGTYSGITIKTGQEFRSINMESGLMSNSILGLLEDDDSTIWVGTTIGLNKLTIGKNHNVDYIYTYTDDDGMNGTTVFDISKDSNGNIWLAAFAGGITRFDKPDLTIMRMSEGISASSVFSILEDSDSIIWFGTDGGGVSRFDGEKFTIFKPEQGLSHERVWSIHEDRNKNIWFGTESGLTKYDGLTMYSFTEGIFKTQFPSITETPDGNIWMSSLNGILRFDGHTFFKYNQEVGLPTDVFNTSFLDSKGNLWFGSDKHGLVKITSWTATDLVDVQYLTTKDGLSNNSVRSIYEDSDGIMWFGSNDGLNAYDGENFESYYMKNGLSGNLIWSIVEDQKNRLWIGTDKGLCSMHNVNGSYQFKILNKKEGLKNIDFQMGAGLIDHKNKGWWGNGNGTVSISLDKIKLESNEPKIQITRVDLNDRWVDYHKFNDSLPDHKMGKLKRFYNLPENLDLPSNLNFLTIHFSGIDWGNEKDLRYQYRLIGFDEKWSKETVNTKVEYRKIPLGSFSFEVRAMGSSGNWTAPANFDFTIQTPWFLTWWAKLIWIIMIVGSIRLVYMIRVSQLNNQKKELRQLVNLRTSEIVLQKNELKKQADHLTKINDELKISNAAKNKFFSIIAHDLRAPINTIISLNGLLVHEKGLNFKEAKKFFKQIYESTIVTGKLLNNLLDWSRMQTGQMVYKPKVVSITKIMKENVDLLDLTAKQKSIKISLILRNDEIFVLADKYMIQAVVRNLISNAIKFTNIDGQVTCELNQKEDAVQITISDTGIGIASDQIAKIFAINSNTTTVGTANEKGTGLGLLLCQEFLNMHQSEFLITSEVGKGSKFTFSLPLGRD